MDQYLKPYMAPEEMQRYYRGLKSKRGAVKIIAELNACDPQLVKKALKEELMNEIPEEERNLMIAAYNGGKTYAQVAAMAQRDAQSVRRSFKRWAAKGLVELRKAPAPAATDTSAHDKITKTSITPEATEVKPDIGNAVLRCEWLKSVVYQLREDYTITLTGLYADNVSGRAEVRFLAGEDSEFILQVRRADDD